MGNGETAIDREHITVIRDFIDKQTALAINRGLMELEKLDPDAMKRMEYYVKGAVDALKSAGGKSHDAPIAEQTRGKTTQKAG